jgi:hypothetical protein
LDRLLAELDSGDMDGSRENSENESGSREGWYLRELFAAICQITH